MCSPTAFILNGREETPIMEDIQSIRWENPTCFILTDIIGNKKRVEGKILFMDLINHRILIEGHVSD